jgi:hypothetical protein
VGDARDRAQHRGEVAADLVEYLIVSTPDLASLSTLVPALAALADSGLIRILDLVALERHPDGAVEVLEFEAVTSLSALAEVEGQVGHLLTEHDIAMASTALRPGTAGILFVTEDRWARPLSLAARQAGGQIVAGERVPRSRVEAAYADAPTSINAEDDHRPSEPHP